MTIPLSSLRFVGHDLHRPECVLTHASGLLIVPDWSGTGGIAIVEPDGTVARVHSTTFTAAAPLRPNGIALEDGGTVLVAHLGDAAGGIYRLHPDGHTETVTDWVHGTRMPPANFVAADRRGRLWITVSTTRIPRALDYRPDAATGFIALHDAGETRIVAEGLGYTNECLLSEDDSTLWVIETFARRLTAFDVAGGRLVNRRTIAQFGPGTFPDGLAEAEDGSIFVASIVSNRVLRVWPDGRIETMVEDVDGDHLAGIETTFQAGEMGRPHLDQVRSRHLRNTSNIAFGGPHRRTAFLGCLLGGQIARFESPVAGRELPHWTADLGALSELMQGATA